MSSHTTLLCHVLSLQSTLRKTRPAAEQATSSWRSKQTKNGSFFSRVVLSHLIESAHPTLGFGMNYGLSQSLPMVHGVSDYRNVS